MDSWFAFYLSLGWLNERATHVWFAKRMDHFAKIWDTNFVTWSTPGHKHNDPKSHHDQCQWHGSLSFSFLYCFLFLMYFLSHSFCGSFGTRLVCTLLQSATWSRETLSPRATIPVRPIMFKYVPPLVIYYTSWSPQDHVIIYIASHTCQFVLIYCPMIKASYEEITKFDVAIEYFNLKLWLD